ncbi:protein transport protein Sec24C-like [Haliotis rufescens]|uniref:protein transport protein Sec24C-like n=1 Tax=Haliotis rufescens TaxID=6454 RepID=UPI001EB0036C|nr:protein transport protein Sec24C-like [Haliotis rufescens]
MSAQFPGNYGYNQGGAPPPPGPMGGMPPRPGPPGGNMYNHNGPAPPMQPGPPGAGQFGGAQPPQPQMMKPGPPQMGHGPTQNGPTSQNGPPPGPHGDNRFGAQRGPAPGPPRPGAPGQMMGGPLPPGPTQGTMMRGPPPPNSMGGGPPNSMGGGPPISMGGGPPNSMAGPPQPSSMGGGPPPHSMGGPPMGQGPPTSQFNSMKIADQRAPAPVMGGNMGPGGFPPPGGMRGPVPQQNLGAPPMSSHQPPTMGSQQTNFGAPSMAPTQTNYGAPPSSMGPPQTNFGAPPSMGPPTSVGAPPQPGMPPMGGQGFPPTSAPPTSFGQSPVSMGGGMPPGPGTQPGFSHQPGPGGFPPPGPPGPPGPPTSQYSGYVGPQMGQGMPPQPGGQPGGQFQGGGGPPAGPQGFGQQQFQYGAGGQRPQAQPQQPRRLDPDQMPSPIQVIEDDRRNRSGLFQTNAKGTVPPLVTTEFNVQDQGMSNPRFIRSTMYNVPCTSDMIKSSHIPFALSITPFAKLPESEQVPPLVDLGELGPVRCKRCKAYMNPFMQFIDGGRRFQCVYCGAATEVPAEYFAHLDHTGRRVDCYNRAELCLGTYEFTATKDYCKNSVLPKEPAFIFMIDVSYNSVKSGLVQLVCDNLKDEVLVNLPKETGMDESEIRVGFVTYHKELHFYNVKSTLAQPQMLVVSDVDDMFVPLLDGFLVKLSESEAVIDSLLAQIPVMFAESKETETVFAPVVQAGLDALRSADRTGKLYIFHTTLPIADAPGKLKNRDDRKLLGTEKEKAILTPSSNFYTKLGQECVAAGCSVDLFLFPNAYTDIASMGEVCRLTSGNMYKYSYFQADIDGERFIEDLKRNVMRPIAFDGILRVRTSQGIRPVDFFGNFYMSNTTDVEMAAIDCDQSINVDIKHDDKLNEAEGAYVQVAVLYTTVSGQRRLRVHNLAFNCCTQMADLFRSCELDVLVNYLSKYTIGSTLNSNPKQVREYVMNEVAQILACYRKNCASPSSAGQLILPECMKLLPLYANCVLKSDGVQGGSEISTDDRSYLIHLINSMNVETSNVFFYPRLMPLHEIDLDGTDDPAAIRCSHERLQDSGIYLLENGLSMFVWIGHNADPDWIQKIFGVQSAAQIDIDKCQLLPLDNPISRRVCETISKARSKRNRFLKLTIIRQRDKLEPWFNHFLVEDKGLNGSASYVDFLCHIHKEIRNILS